MARHLEFTALASQNRQTFIRTYGEGAEAALARMDFDIRTNPEHGEPLPQRPGHYTHTIECQYGQWRFICSAVYIYGVNAVQCKNCLMSVDPLPDV